MLNFLKVDQRFIKFEKNHCLQRNRKTHKEQDDETKKKISWTCNGQWPYKTHETFLIRLWVDLLFGEVTPSVLARLSWGHLTFFHVDSFQFSSVAQSCPTLWDPMNRSTPGLPVQHQLLESTQTHAHLVGDAIQPSHPLSSPSPPASTPPSIRVFSSESALHMRWPKEFYLKHSSWVPRRIFQENWPQSQTTGKTDSVDWRYKYLLLLSTQMALSWWPLLQQRDWMICLWMMLHS